MNAARTTRCSVSPDASRQTGQARQTVTLAGTNVNKICRSYRKHRRGASAVEFAIVAPIFILLIFGMIEYGRMVMVQQLITNAAREGARQAVLDGATTANVQSTVTTYLSNSSVSGATVTVSPDPPSNAGAGDPVTVNVSIPFTQVSWLPSPMYLGATTMTASAVMRRETVD
jgi:Flp pilus assembly protein TadG